MDLDSSFAGVPTVAYLHLEARVWFGHFSGSVAKIAHSFDTEVPSKSVGLRNWGVRGH